MAGRGRRRSEYRIFKDREKMKQLQNRSRLILESLQMMEEMDEAVMRKKALIEKMRNAFALDPVGPPERGFETFRFTQTRFHLNFPVFMS